MRKRLFVIHFDLIPTKGKQEKDGEMAEAVQKFWTNLKAVRCMYTLMWLKGKQLQYYYIFSSLITILVLFFFFSWNIFNIQMRFQPQWLIYNSFNPIFIKNKVAETEVRRPHMSNKHMYCNGKYFIQWILPTNVIR